MESIHGDERGASAGNLSESVPELQIDDLPISRVREGMAVVDAAGEKVGDVSLVHLGDPEAITLAGQEGADEDRDFIADIAAAIGAGEEPKVPEAIRRRMIREGFIKIDGGFLRGDWYALPEQIAAIAGDTVRLNVDKVDLVKAGTGL